ncbi:hypothetical protein [Edwardsiella tarda]
MKTSLLSEAGRRAGGAMFVSDSFIFLGFVCGKKPYQDGPDERARILF